MKLPKLRKVLLREELERQYLVPFYKYSYYIRCIRVNQLVVYRQIACPMPSSKPVIQPDKRILVSAFHDPGIVQAQYPGYL